MEEIDDTTSPLSRSIVWPLVAFAIFALALVTVSALVFNRVDPNRAGVVAIGDNCNVLECPAGVIGPTGVGVAGPPGSIGETGPTGATGQQGVQVRNERLRDLTALWAVKSPL